MFAIFNKEVKSYFHTTTGYIFIAAFLFLFGIYFTYLNIFPIPNNAYTTTISNMILVFVLISPILTMRTLAEEKKNQTDQLLFTSTTSVINIVIGKYLAAVMLFFIPLVITFLYPIILNFFGEIPFPTIITAYIGFFFMGNSFIALGIFISSLTENQVAAGISTLGVFLFIWLLQSISNKFPKDSFSGVVFGVLLFLLLVLYIYRVSRSTLLTSTLGFIGIGLISGLFVWKKVLFEGLISSFFNLFSIHNHSVDFYLGILSIKDIVYFLSFIIICIYLTHCVIEKRRWN